MSALFLVGPPGVGKTSLAREMFKLLDPMGTAFMIPKPKWTVAVGAYAAAGHYTGQTFDGADTVSYTGAMDALSYWALHRDEWRPQLTVFDGDRFSYDACVRYVSALVLVNVILLTASEELLAARRAERGSNQNASWAKGRATKAARFSSLVPDQQLGRTLVLEATKPPSALASDALDFAMAVP